MKEKIKIIQVDEETHYLIKLKAIGLGITIKEYIKQLVERDN